MTTARARILLAATTLAIFGGWLLILRALGFGEVELTGSQSYVVYVIPPLAINLAVTAPLHRRLKRATAAHEDVRSPSSGR